MNYQTQRVAVAQEINGQAEITGAGLAVLLGVTVAEVDEQCEPQAGLSGLPPGWRQLGQRRVREAQIRTGRKSAGSVLMYWATKRFGIRAEFDYDADTGTLWMLLDAGEVI